MVVITHNVSKCWTSFSFWRGWQKCVRPVDMLTGPEITFVMFWLLSICLHGDFFLSFIYHAMPRLGKLKHFLHEEDPILICKRKIYWYTPKVVWEWARIREYRTDNCYDRWSAIRGQWFITVEPLESVDVEMASNVVGVWRYFRVNLRERGETGQVSKHST